MLAILATIFCLAYLGCLPAGVTEDGDPLPPDSSEELTLRVDPPDVPDLSVGQPFTVTVSALSNGAVNITEGGSVTLTVVRDDGTIVDQQEGTFNNGVATFTFAVPEAGQNFSVVMDAPDYETGGTLPFNVVEPGTMVQLAFTSVPQSVEAGQSFDVLVAAQDVNGNVVPSASGSINLDLGNNPGNSPFTPRTANLVGGVATFNGLQIANPGVGYTLLAGSSELSVPTIESSAFDVTAPLVASFVELIDAGGFAFTCDWNAVTGAIDAASKRNNTNLNHFGVGVFGTGPDVLYTTRSGFVQAHAIDATGALSELATSPYATNPGSIQLTLTPGQNFLYAISGVSSTASGFTRNADGSLTALPGSPFAVVTGATFLTSFAAGGDEWLCIDNLNQLNTYRLVAGVPTLTDTDAATPVVNLAADPQQPVVYGDTAANTILGFSLDPVTGLLTPLAGNPFPRGGNGPTGRLLVHPTLPFLFAVNPTSGNVSVFQIGAGGALSPVAGSPFNSIPQPTTVAFSPDGNFVYVGSAGNNGMSLFTLDNATGALTPVGAPISLDALSGFFFSP